MSDVFKKLKSLDIFQSVSEQYLHEIAPHFKISYLKHRKTLFKENDAIENIHIILYGSFKIVKKIDPENSIIFNFLESGQFLGITMNDITRTMYPASAVANEDSAVLYCSRQFFNETLLQKPFFRMAINKQIRERFLEFQNDRCLENIRVPQKLADFLLRLLERQKEKNNSQIMMPITRKDIAQRLSIQTETVIRIFSAWTKKGWIQTVNKRIVIHDVTKLRELRDEKPHKHSQRSTSEDSPNAEPTSFG
ncbi:MAG: Crp/Fnr family transcriptional regulator [Pseudobdellovibrionaceae bacterium]